MAEHELWPEQPRGLVDVEIVARVRIELPDVLDLVVFSLDVRLDVESPGYSRTSAPAASSCAGVEVIAKRGVIA